MAYHVSGVARCNLTIPLESVSFFSLTVLRIFPRMTVICVVYRDLKKLIWQNNEMAYHVSGVARCNLTFPVECLSFFNYKDIQNV